MQHATEEDACRQHSSEKVALQANNYFFSTKVAALLGFMQNLSSQPCLTLMTGWVTDSWIKTIPFFLSSWLKGAFLVTSSRQLQKNLLHLNSSIVLGTLWSTTHSCCPVSDINDKTGATCRSRGIKVILCLSCYVTHSSNLNQSILLGLQWLFASMKRTCLQNWTLVLVGLNIKNRTEWTVINTFYGLSLNLWFSTL